MKKGNCKNTQKIQNMQTHTHKHIKTHRVRGKGEKLLKSRGGEENLKKNAEKYG